MRPLKYHVALTVDGFIGHEDGTVAGFSDQGDHVTDFLASFAGYGAVLMGRKTYEFGLKLGVTSPYPSMKQYVLSRSMKESPDPAVELVADDVVGFVRRLKEEDGKPIWLCGGAELASTLFAAGLIDEIILKLNPVLFGAGIPLFAGAVAQTALELIESKVYGNGVVLLHYRVKR
jgi:dihydrofolate reductase